MPILSVNALNSVQGQPLKYLGRWSWLLLWKEQQPSSQWGTPACSWLNNKLPDGCQFDHNAALAAPNKVLLGLGRFGDVCCWQIQWRPARYNDSSRSAKCTWASWPRLLVHQLGTVNRWFFPIYQEKQSRQQRMPWWPSSQKGKRGNQSSLETFVHTPSLVDQGNDQCR